MEITGFIILAYAIAATLIVALCLNTWLRARAVKRALGERSDS